MTEAPADIQEKARICYFADGPVSVCKRARALGVNLRSFQRWRDLVLEYALVEVLQDRPPRPAGAR